MVAREGESSESAASIIKDSVVLTLHNRDHLTIWNVLRALMGNDLTDTEIVLIDDGSDEAHTPIYAAVCEFLTQREIPFQYVEMEPYEAYRIAGHNNPAHANNRALELVRGERLVWLSSDVIIPPNTLAHMRRFEPSAAVWVPQVLDMATGMVWNGPQRYFPMMWCVAASAKLCKELRFDEEYLKGMAFEDNDFMGRLAVRTGAIVFDWEVLTFHQSHAQTAYSDQLEGFKRSAEYTKAKWHGVPFASDKPCLSVKRGMSEKGVPEWKVGLLTKDAPVAAELGVLRAV